MLDDGRSHRHDARPPQTPPPVHLTGYYDSLEVAGLCPVTLTTTCTYNKTLSTRGSLATVSRADSPAPSEDELELPRWRLKAQHHWALLAAAWKAQFHSIPTAVPPSQPSLPHLGTQPLSAEHSVPEQTPPPLLHNHPPAEHLLSEIAEPQLCSMVHRRTLPARLPQRTVREPLHARTLDTIHEHPQLPAAITPHAGLQLDATLHSFSNLSRVLGPPMTAAEICAF